MKGFFALIVALILVATCILGSITPQDEDEGTGFGIMGVIFSALLIVAARITVKEKPKYDESSEDVTRVKNRKPRYSAERVRPPASGCGKKRTKTPTL